MSIFTRLIGVSIFLSFIIWSCSEDEGPIVDEILLTIDKEVAIAMRDSVLITTEVHSPIDERLQNIPLEYFVDDIRLDGPIFYPDKVGTFRISARYQDVVSTKKDVKVITLEDNISSLDLVYDGHNYLTTEDWSVSGSFNFLVQLDLVNLQVSSNDIDLLVNGVPIDERDGIHFETAGEYDFQAALGDLRSEPQVITVRNKLELQEITIPVVFHDLGYNFNSGDLSKLIDTLNASFSHNKYPIADVKSGIVNPNAVNLKMKFELATEAPEGFTLSSAGIQKIDVGQSRLDFSELTLNNTWNPDKYVNVWIVDLETEIDEATEYVDYGRGWASRPQLQGKELQGLITLNEPILQNNAGIAVLGLSVFGEHRDYLVTMMGAYYGLYGTFDVGCGLHGDYIQDTKTINLEASGLPPRPTNFYYTCDEDLHQPSNFMSIGRKYRDFTYDQALRIRTVIEHGISRASGD